MDRVFVIDRDLARRSQLRSRLVDLELEVQAVARLDEVNLDRRVDVGLFHVHELLREDASATAVSATVAYSSDPEDDRFGAAAFDRGAQVFIPSTEFGTVERVVAARLRSLALGRRVGERQAIALLENRSLRGAAQPDGGTAGNARRADGVLLVDPGLRAVHLGGAAAALLGRDVLGWSLNEIFPGSDLGAQVTSTTRAPRELVRVDLPASTTGIPGRSLAVTIHPLHGDSGWLLFLSDVVLGAGMEAALRKPAAAVPVPEVPALIDAASEVFSLDPARYLDSPTGEVRRAFPALVGTGDPVLVRGESGTGRGHVARALHYQSAPSRVLFEVGCRGRSPAALEAELFGAGSDHRARGGLARFAAGGTLLVHDIDRLPRHCQELLLTAISADDGPRLIATTTCASTFPGARFEPGLRRRLEAHVLTLSTLRERPDQLESLVRQVARCHGASEVSPAVLTTLAARDWPGNLVELSDVVSRAARAAGRARIESSDLPRDWIAAEPQPGEHPTFDEVDGPFPAWVVTDDDPVSFEVYERKAILRALDRCAGDRLAAAHLLGIGKSTIYRKIGELGIEVDPARANG